MKISKAGTAFVALCFSSASLLAGAVGGRVYVSGKLTSEVLVSIEGLREIPAGSPETVRLLHTEGRFDPHVLPIVVGTSVEFDTMGMPCRLYSASPERAFNLMRQEGEVKVLTFDEPAVVRTRCQEHPDHTAFIVVKENPYFTLTDAMGKFAIIGIPEGHYTVNVWWEGRLLEQRSIQVGGAETFLDFRVELPHEVSVAGLQQEAAGKPARRAKAAKEDEFLSLGVGGSYQKLERFNTVSQINSFIPPLYQPIFVGHGYVLPPGAMRVGANWSIFDVESGDFLKAGEPDFVHENHKVDRTRVDFDFFYGLEHNMTLRVNVPFWTTRSVGSVHPAGVRNMDLFVEGNNQKFGDVSVLLKKKWWDQANFYFNFATVTGVKLPTGSNDQKFDMPMVVRLPTGNLAPAFGGGAFPRFADDGRLPLSLQPGTGNFGLVLGFMGTRQFLRSRSALHGGTLMNFFKGEDGVEPGDEVRFFASYVRPVYKEKVSLDLTFNGMHKGSDRYAGVFTHPVPGPDGNFAGVATTPRPAFQGGTVLFFSPGFIWSPDPQVRLVATASLRVNQPELGPWPGFIFQMGVTYTFSLTRRGE